MINHHVSRMDTCPAGMLRFLLWVSSAEFVLAGRLRPLTFHEMRVPWRQSPSSLCLLSLWTADSFGLWSPDRETLSRCAVLCSPDWEALSFSLCCATCSVCPVISGLRISVSGSDVSSAVLYCPILFRSVTHLRHSKFSWIFLLTCTVFPLLYRSLSATIA